MNAVAGGALVRRNFGRVLRGYKNKKAVYTTSRTSSKNSILP